MRETLKQFIIERGKTAMKQKNCPGVFHEVPIPKELLELKKEMKKPV